LAVHRFVTRQSTCGERRLKSFCRLYLRHNISPSYLDGDLWQRLIADLADLALKEVYAGSPLLPATSCMILPAATQRPVKLDRTPEQNGTARHPDARL